MPSGAGSSGRGLISWNRRATGARGLSSRVEALGKPEQEPNGSEVKSADQLRFQPGRYAVSPWWRRRPPIVVT